MEFSIPNGHFGRTEDILFWGRWRAFLRIEEHYWTSQPFLLSLWTFLFFEHSVRWSHLHFYRGNIYSGSLRSWFCPPILPFWHPWRIQGRFPIRHRDVRNRQCDVQRVLLQRATFLRWTGQGQPAEPASLTAIPEGVIQCSNRPPLERWRSRKTFLLSDASFVKRERERGREMGGCMGLLLATSQGLHCVNDLRWHFTADWLSFHDGERQPYLPSSPVSSQKK